MVAGIPMNGWDLISYYWLHFSKLRYLDWAGVVMYGEIPKTPIAVAFALISHFFWVGFLGVIFAYLIPTLTPRGYLVKGFTFGFITGFIIYAIGIAFKFPIILHRTTGTTISQFIGGSIWGVTLALMLRWLDTTPKVKS